MEGDKLAILICHCNGEIDNGLKVSELFEFANSLSGVVKEHEYLCGRAGLEFARDFLKESEANKLVLVGCSPRTYRGIFLRALSDFKGLIIEHANIREQCAWAHEDRRRATEKAKVLVRMAVHRVLELETLEKIKLDITPSALVIGGGVAGMQATFDIASRGFRVFLVERSCELGGRVARLSSTFPTIGCGICCMHNCPNCELTPKIEEIYAAENIEVLTHAEVAGAKGHLGNYKVKVKVGEGGMEEERELNVGTVIIATGSKTFDPKRIPEYGYEFEDVITAEELEEIYLNERLKGGDKLVRPSDGQIPKRVNFIQCVGSRGLKPESNPYCSITCCLYAMGHARKIKERYPDAEVYIHYVDLRSPYRGFEEYYNVALDSGVKFVRGLVDRVEKRGEKLVVVYENAELRKMAEMETELVVLSVGQEPSENTAKLSEMFHVGRDIDGFFMELNPRFLVEEVTGVYVAGGALGPRNIRYAVADGRAAAENAIRLMEHGFLEKEGVVPEMDEDKCIKCATCFEICPFGAIELTKEREMRVVAEACWSCGICAAECPARALNLKHYKDEQIFTELNACLSF
ncbi:MAG: CoB--CoM heterodisulfide reductase iron-sulfur subunit A family protein [Methanophagales archaeon]|nr:CoB--CoM heterodisulfide reductase iron-sulfur subunit A family protein [Methanophagales archaeon]